MLDHHIQRHVVATLSKFETARFADLRPERTDSNIFSYHLKRLMSDGLVEKAEDNRYTLTADGRRLGFNAKQSRLSELSKAYSVILLAVRCRKSGRWLLRKRLHQPMINKIGFLHALPEAELSVCGVAARDLAVQTGIDSASFQHVGEFYVSVFDNKMLESFLHASAVLAEVSDESLLTILKDERNEFGWFGLDELGTSETVPSLHDCLKTIIATDKPFFSELRYELTTPKASRIRNGKRAAL